jgi:hypothetical protein
VAERPIKIFDTLRERYPEAEDPDVVHGSVKVALSAIPVLGSPINELFSMVVTPSLARRRDAWLGKWRAMKWGSSRVTVRG